MVTELIHIGFSNILAVNRVVAIVSPNSAPSKRMIQEAKKKGLIIDMTNGRRTKAIIVLDTGYLVLAAIAPETVAVRVSRPVPADTRVDGQSQNHTQEPASNISIHADAPAQGELRTAFLQGR